MNEAILTTITIPRREGTQQKKKQRQLFLECAATATARAVID
jgi:hypothetical protein